jgi:hypothetical protein
MPEPRETRPRFRSPARRELTIMMGLVVVVHTIAIAIYRLSDMPHRPLNVTRIFGAIWTAVTLIVVFVGLNRVRAARRSGR